MNELDRIFWGLCSDELGKAADAMALAVLEPVEPTFLAPTAPRIRVERCIDADVFGQVRYADGWLCIWGDGGSDWCPHLTWRAAMDCALDRARARALGILGRW
ncbi:hypothetical protein [uncultured Microbacterium sp.]|uniref:hypothetical protein n=1 Tax=uncultured Microbacterium sp. TaxID=191216 RepID=UPI0025D64AA5|nr:hypothetical protein [uncultured Microbacterium sp.]